MGERLDARLGFATQKPGVSTLHPTTHAGVSGSATVEHDGDMRIRRCIFQATARSQDASRAAAERFAQELRRAEWKLHREDSAPDYVAGGRMQTFTKDGACRFVFWGCTLSADDCAATVAHAECPPPP